MKLSSKEDHSCELILNFHFEMASLLPYTVLRIYYLVYAFLSSSPAYLSIDDIVVQYPLRTTFLSDYIHHGKNT